jgi:hypothetical protein
LGCSTTTSAAIARDHTIRARRRRDPHERRGRAWWNWQTRRL